MEIDLEFAKKLAHKAGKEIVANFKLGMERDWKGDDTPVTVTDKAINSMVVNSVKEAYPDSGILGEEESFEPERQKLWICDPIDGTLPFTYGIPISTFCLALVEDGDVKLGVIYDPFMDRLYHATKGGGAFLNDEPIHVNDKSELKNSAMSLSSRGFKEPVADVFDRFNTQGAKIFMMLSFAYGTTFVANGEFVTSVFGMENTWDVAASKVIIEEAGGKVSDLDGNDQRYDQPINGFVASNGTVHDDILEILHP